MENEYLGQVLEQQQRVDQELKRKVRSQRVAPAAPAQASADRSQVVVQAKGRDSASEPGRGVDCRITGWGRFRTVVVPPNVYVVHTRRGESKPRHVGMGLSFRFNPFTDAFLVVPAAMQTIVINARCICVERQGILVQAYVQWIIDDVETAYRKLDFSDPEDPMGIVNVQLREQAEAAIKDKVATMRIDEVLADKQPIIEELTLRLRAVAEGSRKDQATSGLGLKIVTVQIKEAVVSSTRLWENLQKPFRAERERLARMAELETERQIVEREREIRREHEGAEVATEAELNRQRAEQEREKWNREQGEFARRAKLEQEREVVLERNATEKAKREAELELALTALEVARRKVDSELQTITAQQRLDAANGAREQARATQVIVVRTLQEEAASTQARRDIEILRARREIENDLSEGQIRAQLIAALPQIAEKLPQPDELRSVTISGDGASGGAAALTNLVTGLLALLEQRIDGRRSGAATQVAPGDGKGHPVA